MADLSLGSNLKRMAIGAFIEILKRQNKVLISDTTLRDGEQAPGASLDKEAKLSIARQLDLLGVDAIEAGFPAASKEDFEAVRLISRRVKRPLISALARCHRDDIEQAVNALKSGKQWGITLFIGTSPMLRRHSLNKSKRQIIAILKESIRFALKFTDRVSFGAEDATRTEPKFLYRIYEEAINAGALVIGFPDTVGWLVPDQVRERIEGIKQNVSNLNKALLAIHFHNDLGLALANSLTAIECGANIVQCTINGIGERAGNAALEEIVMAIRTRKDHYSRKTNIDTKKLFATSKLVAELTGIPVSPHKPIVGDNVFTTEAGIHQAALLKDRLTYEIIKPSTVGRKSTAFVLGRHSGKHAVINRLYTLGFRFAGPKDKEKQEVIYRRFKDLAVTKKEVDDFELAGIAKEILKD